MKISIIVGTCERDRNGAPRLLLLEHCLRRIGEAAKAFAGEVEVLVGADGDLRASRKVVEAAGHRFFAFPRTNVYSGGPMRNGMMPSATGHVLWFFDDDDWPVADALTTIESAVKRAQAKTPAGQDWARLLVFKMRYRGGEALWRDGVEAEELWSGNRTWRGHVGTPMVVFPNRPALLGRWGHQNYSDAEMFETTLARGWPWPPMFTPSVIANVRRQDDREPW